MKRNRHFIIRAHKSNEGSMDFLVGSRNVHAATKVAKRILSLADIDERLIVFQLSREQKAETPELSCVPEGELFVPIGAAVLDSFLENK